MSSGSYFPPPVRAVEIPKPHGGGVRLLGVPTIADQCPNGGGYAFGKGRNHGSTPTPMATGRRRQLSMRLGCADSGAGRRTGSSISMSKGSSIRCPGTSSSKRSRLSVTLPGCCCMRKRWLAAPLRYPDGTLVERDKGTPQGSAVSPILANLFMHFCVRFLDDTGTIRAVHGERYADDAVVHCVSKEQAEHVLAAIAERMGEVGLRLHPDKTRIVYCKDQARRENHEHTSFTFVGFTFRARK